MRQFTRNSTKQLKRTTILFVTLTSFLISPLAYHRAFCQGTLNDRFAQVGQLVPAFGGCFTSGDILYVYLVPGKPGSLSQVNAALTQVFGSDRPSGQLQALAGTYTFMQLKAWLDPVSGSVLLIPGTVGAGIDYSTNQLIVLVDNMDLSPQVESEIVSLGIPLGAVEIKLMGNPYPAQNLQARHRPDIGGLQIGFNACPNCCTHWLADQPGPPLTHGFVTASHCSSNPWLVDGTLYSQPAFPPVGNRIGMETVDPPLFGGGACPAGRMCRYSDSNFSPFAGLVGGSTNGVIARPTGLGSINWNGTDTFTVTSKADPFMFDSVDKVGRTTGRTRGTVVVPCVNINGAGGALLLCQFIALMNAANWALGGDSGSPVIEGHPTFTTFVGIAWGSNHCVNKANMDVCPGADCKDPKENSPIAVCIMAFSPQSGIQADLGNLNVCQNGTC
jgi:hypothetical protein